MMHKNICQILLAGCVVLLLSLSAVADRESTREAEEKKQAEERHAAELVGLNGEDEASKLTERQVDLYWRQHAGKYANAYAVVGDRYVACAKWHPAYMSSNHETVQTFLAKHAKKEKVSAGALVYSKTTAPPRAEAEAVANTIPDVALGEYGIIHSGRIVKIMGTNEMILDSIQLIDAAAVQKERDAEIKRMKEDVDAQIDRINAERRRKAAIERAMDRDDDRRVRDRFERVDKRDYHEKIEKYVEERYKFRMELIEKQQDFRRTKLHVKGVSTRGLDVGDKWGGSRVSGSSKMKGTPIAVVDTADEGTSKYRRSPSTFIAVPITALRQGITLNQFEQIIKQAGMTKENFAYLHIRETRKSPQEATAAVVEFIEGQRAKRAKFAEFDKPIARQGERVSGPTIGGADATEDGGATGGGADDPPVRKPLQRVIY